MWVAFGLYKEERREKNERWVAFGW